MATTTAGHGVELKREVRHPLERLKDTIRGYVIAEALLTAGIVLAAWFWLGMLFDFGLFKLFTLDWVVVPGGRTVLAALTAAVALALAGILAVKLLARLWGDFTPEALALVLERRFPAELGDRLITAVELADPEKVAKYGYSPAMVAQTVREAAAAVERVPVREAFDWRRLRRLGDALLALTVGVTAVVGAAACVALRESPVEFWHRFRDTATIWAERNLLFQHVIWPRNAHLELVGFPESGDLRVSRDGAAPRVSVQAYRWMAADFDAPYGWRPARWSDVTGPLVGLKTKPPVPEGLLPSPDEEVTLDVLERAVENPEARARAQSTELGAAQLQFLERLFERLDQRARDPRLGRKFRHMTVPDAVEFVGSGAKTTTEQPLRRLADDRFAGEVKDLKESVSFTVRAGNYRTPAKLITLVPPPMLVRLARDEARPAYLYHRPPLDGGPAALKGLRHRFNNEGVSITGPVSAFEVPAGTEVTLAAEVDKPLAAARLRWKRRPGGGEPPPPLDLTVAADRKGFTHPFGAVTGLNEFDLEFTDTDDVTSRRAVQIKAVEDRPPEVEVAVETVRRTPLGYMVTPIALVPFNERSKVTDDAGIASVVYAFTAVKLDTAAQTAARAVPVVGAFQFVGQPATPAAVGYFHLLARQLSAGESDAPARAVPLETFRQQITEIAAEDVLADILRKQLAEPVNRDRTRLVKQFFLKPPAEGFDLRQHLPDLRVADTSAAVQPRYKVTLAVTATDTNVESPRGPGVGRSKETFTLVVVPEEELLVEVGKEQEGLKLKLEDAVNRLRDARAKLDQMLVQLPGLKPEEFSPAALRAQELLDTVQKSRDVTQEVLNDYQRVLKELRTNRVTPTVIENLERNIALPLDDALRQEFARAEESQERFRAAVADAKVPDPETSRLAQTRLDELILRLSKVLDAMGDVTTVNRLREMIVEIERRQRQEIGDQLDKLKRKATEAILEDLGGDPVTLTPPAPVTVDKGATARVTIKVGRDAFEGAFDVRFVAPPDSGLQVPSSVTVPKGGKEAVVEVTAGTKLGTFAVKASPGDRGAAVEFKVTVK